MIKVEKLSYSFPEKDLYKKVSFTIEDGQHAVLIGSNGTGKTTLVDILLHDEKYLYDGKILRKIDGRIGYVSQYEKEEKDRPITVFDFLSQDFVENQKATEAVCKEMETTDELEPLLERYQELLDEYTSMDGDNYESNIRKQLKTAGLSHTEELPISAISGGEYKLLQVVKQLLRMPALLIMDEPDVFLDFDNLNGLKDLINSYKGTVLAITHNRYLLNHCFNKILHLENADIQEFEGNFVEYNFSLLAQKVEMQKQVAKEQEEIDRNQKIVDKLRLNATRVTSASRGKALHARVSYLERLEARRIKAPFVNMRQPKIVLPVLEGEEIVKEITPELSDANGFLNEAVDNKTVELLEEKKTVLQVSDYGIQYEDTLLENVRFELKEGEKVAIVGPNGTGKTTMLRDIYKNNSGYIAIADDVELGFLSQIHGEMLTESNTIYEEFEALGFETHREIAEYLSAYCFDADMLSSKIEVLSGGEKNLLQLAKIAAGKANLLLLDEPTSHLDTYAQIALEKAIAEYKGTVLMVSHDFYTIVNSVDYILFVEDKSVRKMRTRSFRKMIYENHFSKDYLELEQKKKELEAQIEKCLQENNYETAQELCERLEKVVSKMK